MQTRRKHAGVFLLLSCAVLLTVPASTRSSEPPGHDEHADPGAPATETVMGKGQDKPAPAKAAKTKDESGERKPVRSEPNPKEGQSGTELSTAIDAEGAIELLTAGNERWVSGQTKRPHADGSRREECAAGQHPFATILTCSDSRVPVEEIFDQGVGDVFTIRVAGNVAGTSEAGTIEYGLEHLNTPLLVVMGHTRCGAVAAAATQAELTGNIEKLVDHIRPAVERAARANPEIEGADLAPLVVKENVWQTVTDLLRHSAAVRELVENDRVRVVGAVYDIQTGKVEWMGEHPWQEELVQAFNARSNHGAAPAESPVGSVAAAASASGTDPGHAQANDEKTDH